MKLELCSRFVAVLLTFFLVACDNERGASGVRFDVMEELAKSSETVPIDLPEMVGTNALHLDPNNQVYDLNFYSDNNLEEAWRTSVSSVGLLGSQIINQNNLVFLNRNGKIKSFNLITKETQWTQSVFTQNEEKRLLIGGGITQDTLGTAYVTTSTGVLLSIALDQGTINWKKKLEAPFLSAATVYKNQILVTDTTNTLRSYSFDGNLNWLFRGISYDQVRAQIGKPIPAGELILLPSSNGVLSAVNVKTGLDKWSFEFKAPRIGFTQNTFGAFNGSPKVVNDKIFFGSVTGQFNALNVDGNVLWQSRFGLQGSPMVISNSVFFVSDRNNLIRLSEDDGSLIWTQKLGQANDRRNFFSPILVGSKIWIASSDGELSSFSPLTGENIEKFDTRSSLVTSPVYFSNSIIVFTSSGDLIAFE